MIKPKKPNGRPTIFTETLAAKICQRIADGESIRAICSDPDMPSTTAIFRWIANGKYDGFRQLYEASMQIRLETLGDGLIELADAPIERNAAGAIDSAAVQMRRLQIETRRWILSKLLPRKYGDQCVKIFELCLDFKQIAIMFKLCRCISKGFVMKLNSISLLGVISKAFSVYCCFILWALSISAKADELSFELNELDTAIDMVAAGVQDEDVLYNPKLWSIVREQVKFHQALQREYNVDDFTMNLSRPLSSVGLFESQALNGEIITFDVVAYKLFDTSASPYLPTHFGDSQTKQGFQSAYVEGVASTNGKQIAFLGLVVTAPSYTTKKLISRLVITHTATIDSSVQEWLSALRTINSHSPEGPESGIDGNTQKALLWDCVVCAECFGAAAISCSILCVGGNWDTPGEGFTACFSKCLKAVQGASPTYDLVCFTACGVCSGRSIIKPSLPPPAPVPWEVFKQIQN